jgi:hypothetical protein
VTFLQDTPGPSELVIRRGEEFTVADASGARTSSLHGFETELLTQRRTSWADGQPGASAQAELPNAPVVSCSQWFLATVGRVPSSQKVESR